jgi:hypothetical protein
MVDEVVDKEVVAFRRDVKGLVIHFFGYESVNIISLLMRNNGIE